MQNLQFVDAQQMHKEHPDTFDVPSQDELDNLKIDDSVKVCANHAERFWVTITEINGEKITGLIDNDLLYTNTHGLKFQDIITFFKCHIYDIWQKKEAQNANWNQKTRRKNSGI